MWLRLLNNADRPTTADFDSGFVQVASGELRDDMSQSDRFLDGEFVVVVDNDVDEKLFAHDMCVIVVISDVIPPSVELPRTAGVCCIDEE